MEKINVNHPIEKWPKITNALHPYRTSAIHIIEEIIEPLLGKGLNGEEYYKVEDDIVNLLESYLNK